MPDRAQPDSAAPAAGPNAAAPNSPATAAPLVRGRIDGLEIAVPKETTILEAARGAGRKIPTLCHHEGLKAEAGCRLCLVELDGRLVASCLYPLRADGFEVSTASEAVKSARAFVVALMLARAPDSPLVQALAQEYGVSPDPRLSRVEPDGCLRCSLCVRACAAAGLEAISLVGRGHLRKVAGPFFRPPAECAGCLACVRICPTGIIARREWPGGREVWGREFALAPCPSCGRPFATEEELARPGADPLCPACRRRAHARSLGEALDKAPQPA
jgi:ferredoxin